MTAQGHRRPVCGGDGVCEGGGEARAAKAMVEARAAVTGHVIRASAARAACEQRAEREQQDEWRPA